MNDIGEQFNWKFDENTGIGGHFIFKTQKQFAVNAFMIPLGEAMKSKDIKGMRYETIYKSGPENFEKTYDVNFTTTKMLTDELTSHLQVKIENGQVINVKSYILTSGPQFSRPLGRELAAPVGEALSFMGLKIQNKEITPDTLVMVRYVIKNIPAKDHVE